jgi:trk system potassium uptake protein TrkH
MPVKAIDNLFTATSAVSTTGLVTVTVNESYNFFGQLVILLLIQLGGLGYMTFSSFVILSTKKTLDEQNRNISQTVFSIPKHFKIEKFIISVASFTFIIELVGAILLFIFFKSRDVIHPLWNAIFHSISAFCTAGFSLFPDSLVRFSGNFGFNAIISILSLAGAMGFIVCVDVWRFIKKASNRMTVTTRIIVSTTFWLILVGTVLIFITQNFNGTLAPEKRILFSFFQTMTAMTTVGFNTVNIATLSKSAIMLLTILMIIGASPSGTGGGLKTTTFTAIIGLIRSTIKGEDKVKFWKSTIPDERIKSAVASLSFYLATLVIGIYLVSLIEDAPFLNIFFECASALGTVGLSMGLTSTLSSLSRVIIILMMFLGRVGPLTFGTAMSVRSELIFDNEKSDLAI